MRISLSQPYISIKKLENIELPDFSILTGVNGSGKSHLLKAIKNGHVNVDDIPVHGIHWYDTSNFKVAEPQVLTGQQILGQTEGAWEALHGRQGNPKVNWISTTNSIYAQTMGNLPPDKILDLDNLWAIGETERNEALIAYETKIQSQIFNNANFKKIPSNRAISKALKQIKKPIHQINRNEFEEHFAPYAENGNILSASLGTLFTKYKIDQFLWTISEFDKDNGVRKSELISQYEETHLPPWKIINETLDTIAMNSPNEGVFNFQITDPNNDELSLVNYLKYAFRPQLFDKADGNPRDFSALSSGEQTLLTLAISIFQSVDGYEIPKLILLDEVDASLHPSMSAAMLKTLEEVYIARGAKIIMATHSPSTVAQAPNGSVHVVSDLGSGEKQITCLNNGEAVQVLSEGFIAIDESAALLRILPKDKIGILTEGNNAKILKRFFELHEVGDVVVLENAEAVTCDSQIKSFFEILALIGHQGKVLCVWDCDCDCKKYRNIQESENVFGYVIPKNENNSLAGSGIENAFPDSFLTEFTKEVIVRKTSGETNTKEFDSDRKADFANKAAQSDEIDAFSHLCSLLDKVAQIRDS